MGRGQPWLFPSNHHPYHLGAGGSHSSLEVGVGAWRVAGGAGGGEDSQTYFSRSKS